MFTIMNKKAVFVYNNKHLLLCVTRNNPYFQNILKSWSKYRSQFTPAYTKNNFIRPFQGNNNFMNIKIIKEFQNKTNTRRRLHFTYTKNQFLLAY